MATLDSSPSPVSNTIESPSNQPLNHSDVVTSLLSLGVAAAGSAPIPIRLATSNESNASLDSASAQKLAEGTPSSFSTTIGSPGSFAAGVLSGTTPGSVDNRAISVGAPGSVGGSKHHRRLGSTGKTRRRLSDAREASARPTLISPPSSSGLLSLASLSLSTSSGVKPLAPRPPSTGLSGISIAALTNSAPVSIPISSAPAKPAATVNESTSFNDMDSELGSSPIPISANGKQKKRGIEYKCESCAKIYRHPNCLNKHRWEHTRQWREASKFVLSKHQQVQLLEAATILSFMGDSSSSLPEDRSEWPTFLSGGSLPKAEALVPKEHKPSSSISSASGLQSSHPISSSVPARMMASTSMGGGPRMHDYTLPASSAGVGVVGRPGLVGVPNLHRHTRSTSASLQPALASGVGGAVKDGSGVTLTHPSSSMRSASSGSGSGSGSSGAEEEDGDIEIDVEVMDTEGGDDESDKGIKKIENPAPIIKATKSYPVPVTAPPLGYGSHGRSTSYGSHGANASHNAIGGYAYQSAGAGYHPYGSYGSYGSGSFNSRRLHGAGGLMKREEDEMSVGFSVKEEDEDEEEEMADDAQKKKEESRWDGMEMEVDMDMD